jgi:hypothetical protein
MCLKLYTHYVLVSMYSKDNSMPFIIIIIIIMSQLLHKLLQLF